MTNAYVEIYTESEEEECLQWVDDVTRNVMQFQQNLLGLRWSGIYHESYQGDNFSLVHLTFVLSHDDKDAYQLTHDFILEKCGDFLQNRPDGCHFLLTPESSIDYQIGLGYSGITETLVKFPKVGHITRFAGYCRIEVILSHKKTGFSVIVNEKRSQIANAEIARQYLHARIQFYKQLPKDALWY